MDAFPAVVAIGQRLMGTITAGKERFRTLPE
jgi:hypothetical protein